MGSSRIREGEQIGSSPEPEELDKLAVGCDCHIGDLVVVFQSGAYGLTASPTAFLSHPAPAEILV